jgi:DNA-binding transcriptional LysR family regulator
MSVELRDLRWVIAASQHRSLRQAAEHLNIRQSTLSRRLRNIESCIGVELFERNNGGTRPTIAGREFILSASHILAETNSALRKLQTRSRGENGPLTIGIYASLSTGNMHATLVEHHRLYPEIDVHAVDGDQSQLMCALTNDSVDIAIMTSVPSGWSDRTLPLWSERVIVAIHEHHPLEGNDVIRWSDLAGESVLVPHHGPGPELERLLRAKLGASGRERLLHQEAGLDRLLSLVSAEFGILLMLEGATGIRMEGVRYHEVHDFDGPTRLNFNAYWRQSNGNPTLTPFIRTLRQRYPDLSVLPGSD